MSARDVIAETLKETAMRDTRVPMVRAAAILSALRAAGYAVVPVEPTEAMQIEMWTGFHNHRDKALTMQRVWSAGIAAAQEPTPHGGLGSAMPWTTHTPRHGVPATPPGRPDTSTALKNAAVRRVERSRSCS